MKNLLAKIALVQGEVTHVAKDATHGQGYQYVSSAAVVAKLRASMTHHGIVMSRSVSHVEYLDREKVDKNGKILPAGTLATVHMEFTLFDAESGESLTSKTSMCALDQSDKMVAKAITTGTKYFLMGAFNLTTQEDIEADETVDAIGPTTQKQAAQVDPHTAMVARVRNGLITHVGKDATLFLQGQYMVKTVSELDAHSLEKLDKALSSEVGITKIKEATAKYMANDGDIPH